MKTIPIILIVLFAVGISILSALTIQNPPKNSVGMDIFYPESQQIIGQNDLSCFTIWRVQLNTDVDYNELEKILRDKIADFGSSYDISQREISIENIGSNRVKITVAGAWWIDSNYTSPDLRKSISSIEYVEQIEDFIGGPNEGGCY